ncbi:MAG: hypothetical protein NVSMB69_04860 [Novosphingobium sp.]
MSANREARMTKTDPRIDAYIARAAPFAQPILQHLRALVHRALPGVEETIKWSMPHYMLGGKNVAGMAGFKAHCAFTIHGEGRQGPNGDDAETGMGQYGKITALGDLPDEAVMIERLHAARDRVAASGSATKRPVARAPKPELPVPDELAAALATNAAASAHFDAVTPSARREYNEWIGEAKAAATRERRVAQAVEWIAEGKKRNWKYEKC